mgnify:CR=1 FL=1|jgi:hypothetical protein
MTQKPVMRWMRKRTEYVFHFALYTEDRVFHTSCGRANQEGLVDLSDEELADIQIHPRLRCGNCDISPRSIDPNNENYIHKSRPPLPG